MHRERIRSRIAERLKSSPTLRDHAERLGVYQDRSVQLALLGGADEGDAVAEAVLARLESLARAAFRGKPTIDSVDRAWVVSRNAVSVEPPRSVREGDQLFLLCESCIQPYEMAKTMLATARLPAAAFLERVGHGVSLIRRLGGQQEGSAHVIEPIARIQFIVPATLNSGSACLAAFLRTTYSHLLTFILLGAGVDVPDAAAQPEKDPDEILLLLHARALEAVGQQSMSIGRAVRRRNIRDPLSRILGDMDRLLALFFPGAPRHQRPGFEGRTHATYCRERAAIVVQVCALVHAELQKLAADQVAAGEGYLVEFRDPGMIDVARVRKAVELSSN